MARGGLASPVACGDGIADRAWQHGALSCLVDLPELNTREPSSRDPTTGEQDRSGLPPTPGLDQRRAAGAMCETAEAAA